MQTFLPFADFERSAQSLDNRRLGKQRVETLQIMTALLQPEYGWQNHPAVKMWRGYSTELMHYQEAVVREWKRRGFVDTCVAKTWKIFNEIDDNGLTPWWLGMPELHESHQSNLVRKDPTFYAPLWPNVPSNIPYYWPVT